ncbi:uncharacterized protein LOC126982517 [Eriocheir sinensis]|uniref:uncharacterized protein LOC126982517 n=1 Tax=Eriocheir sinensis TaxID=95602 RepID=UPI0021CA0E25|nr:uncharacterized protein LOC126982517 [Eriocheir sinensis]
MKGPALIVVMVLMAVVVTGRVQTPPPYDPETFWPEFFINVTADVCRNKEELCKTNTFCYAIIAPEKIETEEAAAIARTNATLCAAEAGFTNADFSTLTVKSILDAEKEDVEFNFVKFFGQFGVTRDQLPLMLECLLNMAEQLPRLKKCLVTSHGESP